MSLLPATKNVLSVSLSHSDIFIFHKNGSIFKAASATKILAKKSDLSPNSKTQQKIPTFPFKLPSKFLAQSATAIAGLGFIDAGYSGDWSRIGVISRDTEDWLKISAFLVVPFCLYLIFSLSRESER